MLLQVHLSIYCIKSCFLNRNFFLEGERKRKRSSTSLNTMVHCESVPQLCVCCCLNQTNDLVEDSYVIGFLLQAGVIPLCLRTMELGTELSKQHELNPFVNLMIVSSGCKSNDRF